MKPLSRMAERLLDFLVHSRGYSYAPEMGEPGYDDSSSVNGVLIGDWDDVSTEIWGWLSARGVYCGYCDEWIELDGAAYRLFPDSYHWAPSILLTAMCEYLTPKDDIEDWIDTCHATPDSPESLADLGAHIRAEDLIRAGFTRWGDKNLFVPQAALPQLFDAHPDSIAVCLSNGSLYFRI